MKNYIRSAAFAVAAAIAMVGGAAMTSAPVHAQGIYFGVGPGWHGDDWRWRRRPYYRDYGSADCRVVVRRFWRHGQRVVVRRRECF